MGNQIAFPTLTTTTELISPETAREYLQKNVRNRSVSRPHVLKLARIMLAGEFEHTHQGIAFDKFGFLSDGQHRLHAIVEAGVPQLMQVTRGVSEKAKAATDNTLRVRSIVDILGMEGFSLASKQVVGAARMWMFLKGDRNPPLFAVKEFIEGNEASFSFANEVGRGHRILHHACVQTMLAMGHTHGHGETLREWSEVVKTGISQHSWHSSAVRFRDYWMTKPRHGGSTIRVEHCQRIYASMVAWVDKRPLSKLYAREIEWLR